MKDETLTEAIEALKYKRNLLFLTTFYGESTYRTAAVDAAIADLEAERAAPQAGPDGMPDDVREAIRLVLDELRPYLIVDGYKPQLVWEASQAVEAWLRDAPAPQAAQEVDDEG